MSSASYLVLLLFSVVATLADQGFKPGFPTRYVNAGDEFEKSPHRVEDTPQIDVLEQKEIVHVKGSHDITPAHPLFSVTAGDKSHVHKDVPVVKEAIEGDRPKVEDVIDEAKEILPDDLEKDVKSENDKEGAVPIIPDGTKGPEDKKEVESKPEIPVFDDDLPKDHDYRPQVEADDIGPMGPGGQNPEIPMEPVDESLPEVPMGSVPPTTEISLYDLCMRLGLRRFLFLMHRAGLKNMLFRPGTYRMFVPTDEALGRLPYPMKVRMLRDPAFLRRVLLYHIVDGAEPMPDKTYRYFKTKSPGLGIHMDYYGGRMCVNGVPLSYPVAKAGNGEVYMVDEVIGPLPVGNLAQGLQSAGIFTRLYVLAVEAGILEKELAAEGPYTLFAPTDEAFKHLPKEILEWLSWDNEALKALLLKHIAPGVFYSAGVLPGKTKTIPTLGGAEVVLERHDGGITVNNVPVVRGDLPATNGVMHGIDEVMFTKGLQPRKRPPSLLAGRRRIYPSTA